MKIYPESSARQSDGLSGPKAKAPGHESTALLFDFEDFFFLGGGEVFDFFDFLLS